MKAFADLPFEVLVGVSQLSTLLTEFSNLVTLHWIVGYSVRWFRKHVTYRFVYRVHNLLEHGLHAECIWRSRTCLSQCSWLRRERGHQGHGRVCVGEAKIWEMKAVGKRWMDLLNVSVPIFQHVTYGEDHPVLGTGARVLNLLLVHLEFLR